MTRRIAAFIALVLLAACGPKNALPPPHIVAPAPATTRPGTGFSDAALSPTTQPPTRVPDLPPPPANDIYQYTRTGEMSAAVAGIPTRVYVPNSDSNTVDVIDPTTFEIIDHFKVDRQPQHVTPAWDLRTLYVDNDLGNSLTPIDPATGKPGAPIHVDDPYNLYFTPDGSKAIVVAERLKRLDFRDPHTWQVIGSVPIPYPGVDHADFSADGRTMVISCEFSGWLVRIDVNAMSVTGALHIGGQPIDVKLSADGSTYFVAEQQTGGVAVVDAATFTQRGFVPTGAGAHGLYPSRDGRALYVSNRRAGTVSVLDFRTGALVASWPVGGSPDMGGVTADGRQLWLSGRYNREVYVIDTTTGEVIHRIRVDKGPHGLDIFPQPGRFSLGHTGVYR